MEIHVGTMVKRFSKTNILIASIVVFGVLAAGYTVVRSSASGFFASTDPETGTVATNATVVNDSTASGGKAIQFNSPPATPPPSGGGTGGGGTGGGGTGGGGTGGGTGGTTSDCYPSASNCISHWTTRCPAYPSFPDGNCAGIPAGTTLTKYTGPCTINTANTVIDAKDLTDGSTGCGALFISAPGVVIKRSKVQRIETSDAPSNRSLILQDSEAVGTTEQRSAVSNTNIIVLGSNIHGSAASVQCADNCTVIDSWLHGQYMPPAAGWHDDGFITNGGSNMTLEHNKIICDEGTGACSGDVFLAADFLRVTNVTVNHNLLQADANVQYCTYGASNRLGSDHIVYTNNIFERGTTNQCGKYGPVDIYDAGGTGNVWANNKWDDGTTL